MPTTGCVASRATIASVLQIPPRRIAWAAEQQRAAHLADQACGAGEGIFAQRLGANFRQCRVRP